MVEAGDGILPSARFSAPPQSKTFIGRMRQWDGEGSTFLGRLTISSRSLTEMVVTRILYPDKCPDSLTASKRSRVFVTYLTLGGRIRSL